MTYPRAFPAVQGSILVLEDDNDLASLLRDVLTMTGYDVRLARTVIEAARALEEVSIAAAVLDWHVDRSTAEEIATSLRDLHVPYVFASGTDQSAVPHEHRWAPFVSKPFPITALIDALEAVRCSGVPS